MRACCAPLCVLSLCAARWQRGPGGSGAGAGGRRRTRITLTSPFIGGSDLYATRFSDRFRAFSPIFSLHSDFFREEGDGGAAGTPGDFCFDASRCDVEKNPRHLFSPGNPVPSSFASSRFYRNYPFIPRRPRVSFFFHTRRSLFLFPLFPFSNFVKYQVSSNACLGNFSNNLIPINWSIFVCRSYAREEERERESWDRSGRSAYARSIVHVITIACKLAVGGGLNRDGTIRKFRVPPRGTVWQ